MASDSELHVWVDQDLCTGDGLCAQYAPEVFEFDVDGLAYVKNAAGDLQVEKGVTVPVPVHLRIDVLDAIKDCPGECIHLRRAGQAAVPMDEDERDALRSEIAGD
jgi:ferredoxin